MASAQQKPKKERGARNSKRRNGKAFKQEMAVIQDPRGIWLPRDPSNKDSEKIFVLEKVNTTTTRRYSADGNKLTGKGKPSGKSFLGVSIKRLAAHPSGLESAKAELRAKRDRRNETRRMHNKAERARLVERERENAAAIVNARRRRDGLKADA